MGSSGLNRAIRQNHDLVDFLNRVQPVGHNDDRASLDQPFQGLLNPNLRLGIYGRNGFVQ